MGFNYNFAREYSNFSSNPTVNTLYGSAICTITHKSSGKFELRFKPEVDVINNTVYLVVTYGGGYTPVNNLGNLTVTATDSTVPVYAATETDKIGSNNYITWRRTTILCNSQAYTIELGDPSGTTEFFVDVFYTGVNLS